VPEKHWQSAIATCGVGHWQSASTTCENIAALACLIEENQKKILYFLFVKS